ncbi:MAG: hypothetical protein RBS39_03045 [Phycisphaerales bacterium]|jgi:hypothetical protein|nr:hypothetical protein [Phycisphaerales bacterium]
MTRASPASPAFDESEVLDNQALDADHAAPAGPTASATPNALARATPPRPPEKRSMMDRLDAFVSRLSSRNNFWNRVCSLIWLPYAFKSGIRMKRIDSSTFTAVLPFKKFNRNWYNAMAGAALLGNSEIAGGMYVFGIVGGVYTVVCKNMEYRFLRPCLGPAVYKITPREDIPALVARGGEFDVTLDLNVVQMIARPAKAAKQAKASDAPSEPSASTTTEKERRVGRCTITFHVTPKQHQIAKGRTARPMQ